MTDVYKTHLSQATKKEVVHSKKHANQQLPPVVSGYDTSDFHDYRADSPNSQTGDKIKQQFLSQLQVESLTAQVERLRVSQRERDIEISRLKAENSMLRQRERRNQRDLENMEHETAEAPNIIRRLKDEVTSARSKVKMYYAQIGDDSRIIRQMHDEHLKQKQTITKLESLVSQKHLADRDVLSVQLSEANAKVSELQKQWAESERKLEIVDRNLNSDNRYLRGKLAGMEKEKELVQDQIKEYEENIKEKEKVIASLSIYRYNAIHRKLDGCKVCNKREKEEAEAKRKLAVIELLPQFEIKKLSVTSATSIEFQIQLAKTYPPDHKFTYSQLRLFHSTDSSLTENVQKKKLDTISFQNSDDFVFKVDGFTSGAIYYLGVASGHQDIFGNAVNPQPVLIDAVPNPPKLVTTMILHNPPTIQIIFQAPEENNSSKVLRYRVYQSNSPDFSDQYLAMDLPIEVLDDFQENITISMSDSHTAVPYYFKLTAVNIKGESELSDISNETIIDFPPEKPTKPLIKRKSARSIHIFSTCPPGAGTFSSRFKVTTITVPKTTNATSISRDDSRQENSIIVPATIFTNGKRELHYTVPEVDTTLSYSFSVVAINSIGFSESSEWSDDIEIDYLVPGFGDLKVFLTSASSFTVTAPSSKEIKLPTILGFKVQWASNYEMTENLRSSPLLPCDLKPHLFDTLAEGELIYVTAFFVGEVEEGMPSTPIFVPLASSIPLPPSPPPPGSNENITQDAPPPGILKKNVLTTSSKLSIHEKPSNIHFGHSSYHEPPPNPNLKTRQSTFKRSQTFLDSRAETRNSQSSIYRKSTLQGRTNSNLQRKGSDSSVERKSSLYKSGSLPQVSKSK